MLSKGDHRPPAHGLSEKVIKARRQYMALVQRVPVNEYAELKQRIKQKGLLEQQPAYYTYKILFTLGLLALSIACLVVFNHSWFQLLNAVFLAFVCAQIGFVGHDIGHRQIFRS